MAPPGIIGKTKAASQRSFHLMIQVAWLDDRLKAALMFVTAPGQQLASGKVRWSCSMKSERSLSARDSLVVEEIDDAGAPGNRQLNPSGDRTSRSNLRRIS